MNQVKQILLAIGTLIAIVVSVFFGGKRSGRKDAEQEQETAVAKQQVEAVKKAKEVQNEVEQKTDDTVADKLKSNWVRK